MLLKKPLTDAMPFSASGAIDVTMFLCHLSDESDVGGHLTTDMVLPNCPSGRWQMNPSQRSESKTEGFPQAF